MPQRLAQKRQHVRGSTLFREQAPEESAPALKPKLAAGKTTAVTFVREYQEGIHTYREHRGPNKAAAMAFFAGAPGEPELLLPGGRTPEGNFGRDLDGIYAE